MELLEFIKNYWVQLTFLCTILLALIKFGKAMIESTKCSLRNDILNIYDRCKDEKKITKWQLMSIDYSYRQYKALKRKFFYRYSCKKS